MLSQAGLEISIYFQVTCCSEGSLLACKRMNTKPAGSSLQPRWKLPRGCPVELQKQIPKLIYALDPICFILLGSPPIH